MVVRMFGKIVYNYWKYIIVYILYIINISFFCLEFVLINIFGGVRGVGILSSLVGFVMNLEYEKIKFCV